VRPALPCPACDANGKSCAAGALPRIPNEGTYSDDMWDQVRMGGSSCCAQTRGGDSIRAGARWRDAGNNNNGGAGGKQLRARPRARTFHLN
jgi:hypothetical protein